MTSISSGPAKTGTSPLSSVQSRRQSATVANPESPLVTVDGAVVGTPSYMSPEQASGRVETVDAAADIYSVGAILYTLLGGEVPYLPSSSRLSPHTIVGLVVQGPPRALHQIDRSVPPELAAICDKAMARAKDDRYSSGLEMAEDIQAYLDHRVVHAFETGAVAEARKWVARNRPTAVAIAVAVLLAAGGLVTATLLQASANRSLSDANERIQSERDAARAAHREAQDALLREEDANRRLAAANRRIEEERDAAESARGRAEDALAREELARSDAVAARRVAENTLIDMYTASGLQGSRQGHPQEALLWFASAVHEGQDEERRRGNRVRVATWSRDVTKPVRALSHPHRRIDVLLFHPTGRFLLTRSSTYACSVWDVEREARIAWIPRDATSGTWSSDGQQIALGSADGQVTIRSFPAGDVLERARVTGRVRALSFSRDGQRLAIGADGVRVWQAGKGVFATNEFEHPEPVETLSFNAAGDLLVSSCEDHQARVFKVSKDGEHGLAYPPLAHLEDTGETTVAPIFVDGDRAIVTSSNAHTLAWWDASTGRRLRSVPLSLTASGNYLRTLTASRDGRLVVAGTYRTVGIWEAASGRRLGSYVDHQNSVMVTAFSPDSQVVLSAGWDGSARFWSAPDREDVDHPIFHPANVDAAAFSPLGNVVATAQEGGLVRIWTRPWRGSRAARVPIQGKYSLFKLSHDQRHVVPTGSTHKGSSMVETRAYELATGTPSGANIRPGGLILDAALSPDAARVATATSQVNSSGGRQRNMFRRGGIAGKIDVWDRRSGGRLWGPVTMPAEPRFVEYHPDGARVAVFCAAGQFLLLDAETGRIAAQVAAGSGRREHHGYFNNGRFRFSPDAKSLIAWGIDSRARVLDSSTAELRYEIDFARRCRAVEYSRDGKLLITSGYDGRVRFWNAASGTTAGVDPIDHPDVVFAIHLSPDGDRLLTACRDGQARLWNWREGTLVCAPFRHSNEVMDATFAAGGERIVTASHDKTARVWDPRSGNPLTPPLALGGMGFLVEVTRDQRHAVFGGGTRGVAILDLQALLEPLEMPAADLRTYAEIVSGKRVHEGRGIANLTADEWLSRWRDFGSRHAGAFEIDSSAEELLAAHKRLAQESLNARQWAGAIWHLDQVIAREPVEWSHLLDRALAHRALGNTDAAIADFDRVIVLNPGSLDAWHFRAHVHMTRGDFARAAADFGKAIDLKNDDWHLWVDRARAYTQLRRWDDAAADYRRVLEFQRIPLNVWNDGALLQLAAGRDGAYRRVCRQLFERLGAAREPAALNAAAWACVLGPDALPDLSRAVDAASTALANGARKSDYLNTLGAVLYRAGRYEDAVRRLEESIAAQSTGGNLWDWAVPGDGREPSRPRRPGAPVARPRRDTRRRRRVSGRTTLAGRDSSRIRPAATRSGSDRRSVRVGDTTPDARNRRLREDSDLHALDRNLGILGGRT